MAEVVEEVLLLMWPQWVVSCSLSTQTKMVTLYYCRDSPYAICPQLLCQ